MTSAPALGACPSCKRSPDALQWIDANACRCRFCLTDFELVLFPAMTRVPTVAKPQAVMVAEESTCFFHAENQAEKVCDACGRFLCAVCAVPMGARTLCPSCISSKKTVDEKAVNERTLWDGMALALAVLPIFVWPLTCLTAPATLGVAIYGWKKPQSLVRKGRAKMIAAMVIATIEIGAWITVICTAIAAS